ARARLVSSAQTSDDVKSDIRRIDIALVALVDQLVERLSGEPGRAQIGSDRPGRIVIETTAPGRQLSIVTERFHAGWQAAEDGHCRPVRRVYGEFLGCVVEPGTHRLTLTFEPTSMRRGLQLTLVGLALTAVASLLVWRPPGPSGNASYAGSTSKA